MTEQRVAWGRIGGLENYARHGGRAMTAAARSGFVARFERAVDPNRELSVEERTQRAAAARRAYMLQLSARSAARRSVGRSLPTDTAAPSAEIPVGHPPGRQS